MKKLLIILIIFIATGCGDSSRTKISEPSKIKYTSTAKFDHEEYISFIKNFVEDSLKFNWIYINPVHVKMNMTLEIINDTNTEIQLIPPPPPSILNYKLDSFSFNENSFDSLKIFSHESIYPKGKGDSLFNYYGTGIIVSLPYSHQNMNEVFIDYEIVNWGSCGTDKYQTTTYKLK